MDPLLKSLEDFELRTVDVLDTGWLSLAANYGTMPTFVVSVRWLESFFAIPYLEMRFRTFEAGVLRATARVFLSAGVGTALQRKAG